MWTFSIFSLVVFLFWFFFVTRKRANCHQNCLRILSGISQSFEVLFPRALYSTLAQRKARRARMWASWTIFPDQSRTSSGSFRAGSSHMCFTARSTSNAVSNAILFLCKSSTRISSGTLDSNIISCRPWLLPWRAFPLNNTSNTQRTCTHKENEEASNYRWHHPCCWSCSSPCLPSHPSLLPRLFVFTGNVNDVGEQCTSSGSHWFNLKLSTDFRHQHTVFKQIF